MSETKVVCVKVAHIRPSFSNLREWMKDSENVYIGRRGVVFIDKKRFPEKPSIWANPFKIGPKKDRNMVIEEYEKYILEKLRSGEIPKEKLEKLKGKNLGCWCSPEKCHGDVLVKIIKSKEFE